MRRILTIVLGLALGLGLMFTTATVASAAPKDDKAPICERQPDKNNCPKQHGKNAGVGGVPTYSRSFGSIPLVPGASGTLQISCDPGDTLRDGVVTEGEDIVTSQARNTFGDTQAFTVMFRNTTTEVRTVTATIVCEDTA